MNSKITLIIKKAIAFAVATGSILLYATTPAFAATTIEISGNGSSSNNTANVTATQETTVVQNNDAQIKNDVSADAQTGHNDANRNTGGDVTVSTGNATSNVSVTSTANLNKADVSNCGGCGGDTNALISGNGSDSANKVKLDNSNTTSMFQDNKANIDNKVKSEAETGHNDANRNTGGDTTILSGNATATSDVSNKANANIASVGASGTSGNTGTLSARIVGNGADSNNKIDLSNMRSVMLVQDNHARFKNHVDSSAKTGHNDANDNTGGDVAIVTGNADAEAIVDNMANFNSATAGCCSDNLMAKISGNGADSVSKIKATLENDLSVFQGGNENGGNKANFDNKVKVDPKTGDNDANRNTGPTGTDSTLIASGDATSNTTVTNSGNINLFGKSEPVTIPTNWGNVSFDFHFDLSDLLSLLHS